MKRGFTLVELLVVISVISMLSSIVMVRIGLVQASGRDSVRVQQIHQIDLATKLYVDTYKKVPLLTGCEVLSKTPTYAQASACFAVSTALDGSPQKDAWNAFKNQIADFIKVPNDPCAGNCVSASNFPIGYTYVAPLAMQYYCAQPGNNCIATNESYQIYAPLERQTVPTGSNGSSANYAPLPGSIASCTIGTPTVTGNSVSVPFSATRTFIGDAYSLYRSGLLVSYNNSYSSAGQSMSLTDSNVPNGTYTYTVKEDSVFGGGSLVCSPGQTVTVSQTPQPGNFTVTFVTTGAGTWTAPNGVTSVIVDTWAGGGGGGGTTGLSHRSGGAGGGAGGGFASATVTVIPGTTYNYYVGAGGAGGVAFPISDGKTGEDSMFQASSTVLSKGGGGGATTGTSGVGGATTTGAIGTVIYYGGNGADGSEDNNSGGGGGGAGSAGNGNKAVTNSAGSGGSPDGGNGGSGVLCDLGSGAVGNPGNTLGGGGSGGEAGCGNPITRDGGAGANGKIRLTYTLP